MAEPKTLTKADFEALARFRYGLRLYFRFSEREVRKLGLTPQQYQLLLVIKGFPGRDWATMSEIAERLQCSHNSAVGLVDRSEANALVRRTPHPSDRRAVSVRLTDQGEEIIAQLVAMHREELERLKDTIVVPTLRHDDGAGAPPAQQGAGSES